MRTKPEETKMKKILMGTMLALAAGAAADVQAQRYYDDRDDRYDYRYARYERCNSCGEVIDINRFYNDRGRRSSSSGTGGAVVGAVIGGLLGNQVGSGSGRKAATVAGAVAGGVAGKRIAENRSGGGDWYEVVVRMDTGRRVVLQQDELDGVRIGDRVAVSGGKAREI
jgi:outer membrane lipoprotein SlyB